MNSFMQFISNPGRLFLAVGMMVGLVGFPFADASAALTKDEQNCINALNKRGRLLSKTVAGDVNACVKDFAKGNIADADACATSDPKDKVAKATANTDKDWMKKCLDKGVVPLPFGPSGPAAVNGASLTKEANIIGRIFGTLNAEIITEAVDKDISKCQQKIIKNLLKCQDVKQLEYLKCKKFALKEGKDPLPAGAMSASELQDACLGVGAVAQPDAKGKIAKACNLVGVKPDKIRADLQKQCLDKVGNLDMFDGNECAGATGSVDDMATCIDTIVECEICNWANTTDNLVRDCDLFDNGVADTSCAAPAASCPSTLTFSTSVPGGTCGRINDDAAGTGTDLTPGGELGGAILACGSLYIGGGISGQPPSAVPESSTQVVAVTDGSDPNACVLGPSAGTGPLDCTFAGCFFGPPLPIFNGAASTCVINTVATDFSGTYNAATGEESLGVELAAEVFLTGDGAAPCPNCIASLCVGGASPGAACTTSNSLFTSHDCPPLGSLGAIPIDLSPLTTATVVASDASGIFCLANGQTVTQAGAFGSGAGLAEYIETNGSSPGPGGGPTTFGSVFCIDATGSALIDAVANLPGPGAVSLLGSNVVTP